MKKVLLLAGVAVSAFAFNANAFDFKPYVSAKLNYANIKSEASSIDIVTPMKDLGFDINDSVWGSSWAAGVKLEGCEGGAIRVELEYNYHKKAEEGIFPMVNMALKTQAYFLNAYYDFDVDSKFTPYVGGGIGRAKVKGSINDGIALTQSDDGFAWNLGAGISYAVNDNVAVDTGIRYINYDDVEKTWAAAERVSFDTDATEIYAGIRYTF